MYERLSKLKSPHGVTVDKCIQPSVDNKGDIIGLVAGDPECYEVSTLRNTPIYLRLFGSLASPRGSRTDPLHQ